MGLGNKGRQKEAGGIRRLALLCSTNPRGGSQGWNTQTPWWMQNGSLGLSPLKALVGDCLDQIYAYETSRSSKAQPSSWPTKGRGSKLGGREGWGWGELAHCVDCLRG